ncbi:MAG: C69 family dipeptidase [Ruminococcaceae bacterium]|jgi:dipeptidase|nr:C69 family dipeptidase [Oscillospiraceae bacterium]
MSCTTILVGKNASNDHSTMISRSEDLQFEVKKMTVVLPKDQPRKYKSVLSHVEIELPDDPMRYTACPHVSGEKGIWAATGINACNVGMTATETLTTNSRVLAADPLVELQKAKSRREKEIPGGIGEEDMVVITLPYVKTAREAVLRLGSLLEQYGTYENNGIAFNDENEVWWLDTIGGHHWIARRVPDDAVVINPNQFFTDTFDLDDAFGAKKDHLCSADLREFIRDNHLDLGQDGVFSPRTAFGSRYDSDHIYNTPRAWFIGRYLNPTKYRWDGPDADFTPESDNIPWSFVPEHKVTVEDMKYMLSSYYQGTPYNPYGSDDKRGVYRPIGISRTGVTSICQIRPDMPEEIKAVEWICFTSDSFAAMIPLYANVNKIPAYLSDVSLEFNSEQFYWASKLINVLTDHDFATCIQINERYQRAVFAKTARLIWEYDHRMTETGDFTLTEEANEKICAVVKAATNDVMTKLLQQGALTMRNGFHRADR